MVIQVLSVKVSILGRTDYGVVLLEVGVKLEHNCAFNVMFTFCWCRSRCQSGISRNMGYECVYRPTARFRFSWTVLQHHYVHGVHETRQLSSASNLDGSVATKSWSSVIYSVWTTHQQLPDEGVRHRRTASLRWRLLLLRACSEQRVIDADAFHSPAAEQRLPASVNCTTQSMYYMLWVVQLT